MIPSDNDPSPKITQPDYGFCCTVDGVDRYHTAWGRDPLRAALQCQERKAQLVTLPACPADIADAVRRADGGE